MNNDHRCIVEFDTRKIDDCCGRGHNVCFGTGPMVLEVWNDEKDGTESYYDAWIPVSVNYCPYCGLKSTNAT